jgi:ABC-type phosphate transport system auxiliary subunit
MVVKEMDEGEMVIKGEAVEAEVRELITVLCQNIDTAKNTIEMLQKMLNDQIESLRVFAEKRDVKGTISTLIKIRGFTLEIAEMTKMYSDMLAQLAVKPKAATAMRLMWRS